MQHVLIICGPTATGKTKLANNLAKKLDGELISADSRQIYRGLDIGTGTDKSEIDVPIYGYDLVDPEDSFSAGDFCHFAQDKIDKICSNHKLPILVGGSGLYIKAAIEGFDTQGIDTDERLRSELSKKSTDELFQMLSELDENRASSMNNSDKNNPRRLVRAIELAKSPSLKSQSYPNYDTLYIGLKLDKSKLVQNITKRVTKRVEMGLENEIKNLLKKGVSWEDPALDALGYRQWKGYFEGHASIEDVIEAWTKAEIKYAKRQMTWFKKIKAVHWLEADQENLLEQVEDLVKSW